jgi:hypothetical protein
VAINGAGAPFALSHRAGHSLPLSKLPLLQRMASNDNGKRKMEEKSPMARKRLWHTDDDGSDTDSSDSPEEGPKEEEEEVSLEETSMNQLDTSEEKLYARRTHDTPVSTHKTPISCTNMSSKCIK